MLVNTEYPYVVIQRRNLQHHPYQQQSRQQFISPADIDLFLKDPLHSLHDQYNYPQRARRVKLPKIDLQRQHDFMIHKQRRRNDTQKLAAAVLKQLKLDQDLQHEQHLWQQQQHLRHQQYLRQQQHRDQQRHLQKLRQYRSLVALAHLQQEQEQEQQREREQECRALQERLAQCPIYVLNAVFGLTQNEQDSQEEDTDMDSSDAETRIGSEGKVGFEIEVEVGEDSETDEDDDEYKETSARARARATAEFETPSDIGSESESESEAESESGSEAYSETETGSQSITEPETETEGAEPRKETTSSDSSKPSSSETDLEPAATPVPVVGYFSTSPTASEETETIETDDIETDNIVTSSVLSNSANASASNGTNVLTLDILQRLQDRLTRATETYSRISETSSSPTPESDDSNQDPKLKLVSRIKVLEQTQLQLEKLYEELDLATLDQASLEYGNEGSRGDDESQQQQQQQYSQMKRSKHRLTGKTVAYADKVEELIGVLRNELKSSDVEEKDVISRIGSQNVVQNEPGNANWIFFEYIGFI